MKSVRNLLYNFNILDVYNTSSESPSLTFQRQRVGGAMSDGHWLSHPQLVPQKRLELRLTTWVQCPFGYVTLSYTVLS